MDDQDWEYLESASSPTKPPLVASPVSMLAQERIHVEMGIKIAQERLTEIDKELIDEFPTEVGKFQEDFDGFLVTCSRGDRWQWDNELLQRTYGLSPPKWIKKTYSISRTAFAKLDEEERDSLSSALSITRAGAKVSVQKIGGTSVHTQKSK